MAAGRLKSRLRDRDKEPWEIECDKEGERQDNERELRFEASRSRKREPWEIECDREEEMFGKGGGGMRAVAEDAGGGRGRRCSVMSGLDSGQSDDEGDKESRKYRKRRRSESDGSVDVKEKYVVGMTADVQKDGVFSDPRQVGKFVEGVIGKVVLVRITRTGMVIIQCKDEEQEEKAIGIKTFGECPVSCFRLGGRERRRGVISGVPPTMKEDLFLEVSGVSEARRLTRFRNGEREKTNSVRLTFEGNIIPERVYFDYVCYRVRPFERAPLRCYRCQEY